METLGQVFNKVSYFMTGAFMTPSRRLGWKLLEEVSKPRGECDVQKALTLIQQGASLEERDPLGYGHGATPIVKAAFWGHVEIASALIAQGANLNTKDTFWDMSALGNAVKWGYTDIVRDIIASSTSEFLNKADESGNTVLMSAVREEKEDIVRLLVAAGALLDVKDNDGNTAVSIARKRGVDIFDRIEREKALEEKQKALERVSIFHTGIIKPIKVFKPL